jgi:phytoene synthase
VVRIADEAALIRYAYLVAGAVGRLICPVLGAVDPAAVPFAMDLGIGMQLSNIARDVTEDACRGRVYLPATWLAEEGVDPDALVVGAADEERVVRVVARTVALAEQYYTSARGGFRFLPLRPRTAVVLAAHRYRAIGRTVAGRGVDALRSRTVVSRSAAATFAVAAPLASVVAGIAPSRSHDRRLHRPLAGLLPQVAA